MRPHLVGILRTTFRRSNTLGIAYFCALLLFGAAHTQAQTSRALFRQRTTTPVAAAPGAGLTVPSNLTVAGASNREIDLTWSPSTQAAGTIVTYHIKRCQGVRCTPSAEIGTSATTGYSDDQGLSAKTTYTYCVFATDANGNSTNCSDSVSLTTASSHFTCVLFPTRSGCMDFGTDKLANINAFYQTNGPLSFFNQIKSIYNGASGSATVSADLTTLNFANGMQVNATTNIQAGSSGTATVSSGTVPTLSANGAGQATQNVLYGGTVLASELYPFLAAGGSRLGSPAGFGFLVNLIGKQGVDIQNFKSGTTVNVSSPPFHASAQMEGYLQYNSINLGPTSASGSQAFAGALFVGGSYGYTYISHGYARDYGFGNRVNNDIGQVSAGILINGVAKISASRAFGPSQTFIDSTTMVQGTVNNFKAWSFGISYQSPPPK